MARASTLNAHYTSPTVIKAIYSVERMGFSTGNILEAPACGTGNFLASSPTAWQIQGYMGLNWTASLAGLQNSFIPRPILK